MKAVVYEAFSTPPRLCTVPDPTPEAHGVVLRVMAT
ncbi:MAG TPA: alcohol dehydrogenase, partial [Pseudomonas sp.]|nr:alcohol dehydrogenase [Pseudomonas sp.]